ncbi:hypothetical protein DM860_014633 [Cuscuta australis]|uniref:Uncharacterized protein n=1 Tax=Cuscuta australis TaxID=267555 RepID=A0A328DMG5_9ASTE|nr:hypothetical protein DM860_014633 [Cuscuta australis]
MWQVALGAALTAGSGFLAKALIHSNAPEPDQPHDQNSLISPCSAAQDSVFPDEVGAKRESLGAESIFRFSSSESGANELRKKSECGSGRNNGKLEGFKRNGGGRRVVKKCGFNKGLEKKFYVCLKKRRISRCAPGKCDKCSSKGNSIFGWGVGIGMMCMMSAQRGEINELNIAIAETSKAVEELKDQISQRRTSKPGLGTIISEDETSKLVKSCAENHDDDKRIFAFPVSEEGEYASSVLTDEMHPDAMEMNLLQAELQSELQKLHGCVSDGSCFGGALGEGFHYQQEGMNDLNAHQSNRVIPSELHQKLSQVLIEQQESQIVELESELRNSHHKLHQKESELQALKDCVRRLTDFSIATDSDEETEGNQERSRFIFDDEEKKQALSSEFRKPAMVGNKRASMEF